MTSMNQEMPEPSAIELLIIDDNPGDLRLAEIMLREAQEADFACTAAHSLEDGLRLLSVRTFQAVLLDLSLPDTSGVGGVRSLRRTVPHVPVVVLTGRDDRRLASKALRSGAEDYLVKGQGTGEGLARSILNGIDRHTVRETTAEACGQAATAGRAKTDLLAGLGHELRSRLHEILGRSEAILSRPDGPSGHAHHADCIEEIQGSAARALSLVDGVPEIWRLEAGPDELEQSYIDIADLAQFCARPFETQAKAGNLAIKIELTGTVRYFYGDRRMLTKILINLLANAVEFTPAGGRIRVKVGLDERGDFLIHVADTGIGMDPEALARLLRSLEGGAAAPGPDPDGAGMGLALAKSFTEAHGGFLEIESRRGEGTAVTLRFPNRRKAEAAPSDRPLLDPLAGRALCHAALVEQPPPAGTNPEVNRDRSAPSGPT